MSSKCYDYLAHIGEILEKVKTTQWDSIEKSAKKMAETIAAGHSVYIFGASHAGILAQEMFYRTGGLAVVNAILPSEFMLNTRPVTQTSAMERLEGYPTVILNNSDVKKGDMLLLHSVSGRNTAAIEMAIKSFPFIAAYDSAASIFRAQENTKGPMTISMISNIMNIGGNAILIWVFHLGVAGAAISTLVSRIFCAVVVLWQLRKDCQPVVVKDYLKIRPDWSMIGRILGLGIPSGIENSMFQLGKLAIQSTVSTLGTAAIAAQAMTNILENLNGIAAIGVGVGLMTIVGQCLGAGRKDEAVYYIKKLCVIAEAVIIVSCLIVYALVRPVTILGGMESTSAEMCIHMMTWITIVKPVVWTMAFVPGYGLRAAGDVKFSMITSCCTMWACRFCLCVFLIRVLGFGPMGVWIGMFADWTVRGIIFTWRFHSRKWLEHKVI